MAATAARIAEVLATMRAGSARLVSAAEQPAPARLPSGAPGLDALLGGGLPRGRLCELIGPRSSGRMSASLAMVAAIQARGELAAFVDVADALDPRSAARAGVELARLLWVRPKSVLDGLKAADWILDVGGFGVVVLYLASTNVAVADAEARLSPSARTRMVRGEAPWLKLARRAEQARAALVVVAERSLAGTIAAVTLSTERGQAQWIGGGRARAPLLLDGARGKIAVVRCRLGPPPASIDLQLAVDVHCHATEPRADPLFAEVTSDEPNGNGAGRDAEQRARLLELRR